MHAWGWPLQRWCRGRKRPHACRCAELPHPTPACPYALHQDAVNRSASFQNGCPQNVSGMQGGMQVRSTPMARPAGLWEVAAATRGGGGGGGGGGAPFPPAPGLPFAAPLPLMKRHRSACTQAPPPALALMAAAAATSQRGQTCTHLGITADLATDPEFNVITKMQLVPSAALPGASQRQGRDVRCPHSWSTPRRLIVPSCSTQRHRHQSHSSSYKCLPLPLQRV